MIPSNSNPLLARFSMRVPPGPLPITGESSSNADPDELVESVTGMALFRGRETEDGRCHCGTQRNEGYLFRTNEPQYFRRHSSSSRYVVTSSIVAQCDILQRKPHLLGKSVLCLSGSGVPDPSRRLRIRDSAPVSAGLDPRADPDEVTEEVQCNSDSEYYQEHF